MGDAARGKKGTPGRWLSRPRLIRQVNQSLGGPSTRVSAGGNNRLATGITFSMEIMDLVKVEVERAYAEIDDLFEALDKVAFVIGVVDKPRGTSTCDNDVFVMEDVFISESAACDRSDKIQLRHTKPKHLQVLPPPPTSGTRVLVSSPWTPKTQRA